MFAGIYCKKMEMKISLDVAAALGMIPKTPPQKTDKFRVTLDSFSYMFARVKVFSFFFCTLSHRSI